MVKNIISVTILYKINDNLKIYIDGHFAKVNFSRCLKQVVTSSLWFYAKTS